MYIWTELSLLYMNNIGEPHRDTLELMKPLFKSSFNFFLSLFNSAGAILYGGIECLKQGQYQNQSPYQGDTRKIIRKYFRKLIYLWNKMLRMVPPSLNL